MTPYGDWQLRFFPSVNYAIFAQRERKTRIKSTGHTLGFGTPTAYGGTQRGPHEGGADCSGHYASNKWPQDRG